MFVKFRRFKTEIIVLHMESIYNCKGSYMKKFKNQQKNDNRCNISTTNAIDM